MLQGAGECHFVVSASTQARIEHAFVRDIPKGDSKPVNTKRKHKKTSDDTLSAYEFRVVGIMKANEAIHHQKIVWEANMRNQYPERVPGSSDVTMNN
jgi:hypothetical protein